ncbi:hypothetical protein Tco_0121371 [Tanacetum coccineum]
MTTTFITDATINIITTHHHLHHQPPPSPSSADPPGQIPATHHRSTISTFISISTTPPTPPHPSSLPPQWGRLDLRLRAQIEACGSLFYSDKAYAKILKLYRAYELCDKNKQLHVFDSKETLEDAEKSQLKMNEFQKDEKVQELKIQPIDYGKLNTLYDNFVPQKDLSAEQTYFPSSCIYSVSKICSEEFSSKTKPSMASNAYANNPMLVDLNEMENIFQMLFKLIQKCCKRDEKEMNPIVQNLYFYFIFQNRFKKDVKETNDVFVSVENDLDETFNKKTFLKDRLLEASLAEDIKHLVITSCVEIRNKDLHDEIERISRVKRCFK